MRLPPLRAGPADLDELAGAFLEELGREHGPRRLSASARRARVNIAGRATSASCARP
jgi:transcriptional regulator with GAF, ATPase, and Fis domain